MVAQAQGDVTVDNSGSLYADGGKYAFGVYALSNAGDVDVQRHLMRTLGALAACCTPPIAEAAAAQARRSLRRAVDARMPTEDFVTVEAAFQSAFQSASQKPAA